MKKTIVGILVGACAAVLVLILAALVLVVTDRPRIGDAARSTISFAPAIAIDYSDLPAPDSFTARDGAQLPYRLYGNPETARHMLILLHGSAWHGMQFHAMARILADTGGIAIIVPDLRGHGAAPIRRGDIDHIGQLEEDVADLVDHIAALARGRPVILGGHSSGGGLAVRFAGGDFSHKVDAFILMAPFLRHDAPTTRANSGGWAWPATRRIIGLAMLNGIGITALNSLPVIAFAMPEEVREGPYGGTVTPVYSYRMNTSFAPRRDYEADLAAIDRPLLVIAGEADEAFEARRYEDVISAQTTTGAYHVLPEATHIGLLTDPRVVAIIRNWLDGVQTDGGK